MSADSVVGAAAVAFNTVAIAERILSFLGRESPAGTSMYPPSSRAGAAPAANSTSRGHVEGQTREERLRALGDAIAGSVLGPSASWWAWADVARASGTCRATRAASMSPSVWPTNLVVPARTRAWCQLVQQRLHLTHQQQQQPEAEHEHEHEHEQQHEAEAEAEPPAQQQQRPGNDANATAASSTSTSTAAAETRRMRNRGGKIVDEIDDDRTRPADENSATVLSVRFPSTFMYPVNNCAALKELLSCMQLAPSRFMQVEKVFLANYAFDDETLLAFGQLFPAVTELHIDGPFVTGPGLIAFSSSHGRNIEIVAIDTKSIDQESISTAMEKLSSVKSLFLEGESCDYVYYTASTVFTQTNAFNKELLE
ncbi:hypothetical protein Pelo_6628 [Pelomyxa schiedti]|nr:hypothetical protein Pelo_6628 [Pelomyxa schiedti]